MGQTSHPRRKVAHIGPLRVSGAEIVMGRTTGKMGFHGGKVQVPRPRLCVGLSARGDPHQVLSAATDASTDRS